MWVIFNEQKKGKTMWSYPFVTFINKCKPDLLNKNGSLFDRN